MTQCVVCRDAAWFSMSYPGPDGQPIGLDLCGHCMEKFMRCYFWSNIKKSWHEIDPAAHDHFESTALRAWSFDVRGKRPCMINITDDGGYADVERAIEANANHRIERGWSSGYEFNKRGKSKTAWKQDQEPVNVE